MRIDLFSNLTGPIDVQAALKKLCQWWNDHNDGSRTWDVVSTNSLIVNGASVGTIVPGTVSMYAGSTIPTGYLNCDGTSYTTTAQPSLFSAIGYTWGGSGSNFNVPDLRGRAPIGAGTGSGLSARTLGTQNIGEETHTLIVSEIPANLTVSDPGHVHSIPEGDNTNVNNRQRTTKTADNNVYSQNTDSATTGISVGGGGGAHNNMQPSAVVNFIIKT